MRKRLLALGVIGGALIWAIWLVTHPAPQLRPAQTNGPLSLVISGLLRGTNALTSIQQEGLAERFAVTSPEGIARFTNAFMFRITNRGKQTVEMWGYNSAFPVYEIYVDGTSGLERLEIGTPGRVPSLVYLGPTQSLVFPVIPPKTDHPWHVSISYQDSSRPAIPGGAGKTPTVLNSLGIRIRAWIPFMRKPEPGFYYTLSDRVLVPAGTNRTVMPSSAMGDR